MYSNRFCFLESFFQVLLYTWNILLLKIRNLRIYWVCLIFFFILAGFGLIYLSADIGIELLLIYDVAFVILQHI